jgi:hypothetical protein
VRSHAKASTAGSTQRQAGRLGQIFRGAFAGRSDSSDSRGSGAPAARRLVLPVGLFVALIGVMALLVSPASATKTHLLKETFGSAAQPSVDSPQGIAVDQSSGDVLVIDNSGTASIKRFNSDGTPDSFSATGSNVIDGQGTGDETPEGGLAFAGPGESQIAVDNSGGATDGNIYVTQSSPNVINIFAEDGEYLGQLSESSGGAFSEACGVAVDPSGAVYVGDYSGGIHKFVPAANPPVNADNTATFTTVANPCALAAGEGATAGFLFAATPFGPLFKLDSATGEVKYEVSPDSHTTVSTDPASGHVFAGSGNTVKELDASGAGSATSVASFSVVNGVRGIAVRGSTGEIYLSRNIQNIEVYGPVVALPGVTSEPASAIEPSSATLNGTVNPDGVALEECKFEYGPSESYGETIPCAESPGSIGSGTSPVPVHADISGLEIGTVYHFRLVAKNTNGTVNGNDETLQSAGPVLIDSWTSSVVRTEATLMAKINPAGNPTTYRIEWGLDDSYGSSTPEFTVGSDNSVHTLTRTLTGLQPDTTYHWRLVTTNSAASDASPDHTFTTYPLASQDTSCPNQANRGGLSAALPDCRAYEMVSPVDKNGGDIVTRCNSFCARTEYIQSTPDGNKITYSSGTSFGDSVANLWNNQYIATRGPEGWATKAITPPAYFSGETKISGFDSNYQAFSADLSTGWLVTEGKLPLAPGAVPGQANLYVRDNVSGTYSLLQSGGGEANNLNLAVRGHTKDGSHVVFETLQALTPDAPVDNTPKVYDRSGSGLKLVSILPGEVPNPAASRLGTGAQLNTGRGGNLSHAISDDGSRIFWTTSFLGFGPGQIYVRVDGEETVPVSESVSPAGALFWAASADGSKAVFTLDEDKVPGPPGDLYVFDVDTETPTYIAGDVLGVAGVSDDASRIYFVSEEDLATGATAGERNLYIEDGGTIRFIATFSEVDLSSSEQYSPVAPVSFWRGSRVTPDGQHLAFMSDRSLTGYDNTDAKTGKADKEVYLYDAQADQLICASCNPSGARPVGALLKMPWSVEDLGGFQPPPLPAAAWFPTWQHEQYPTEPLSDDGNRLFFNSFDALVPSDSNGAQDVYQWEAQGTGSCNEAPGCISLISTGESAEESEFVDASPDGSSVFFRTAMSILPQDPGLIDIYVAREGGGYPPPPEPPAFVGDACQSIPEAPRDPTPASATFRGAGDPAPRKARRNCRARKAAKGSAKAKKKRAKRCRRAAKRGAKR